MNKFYELAFINHLRNNERLALEIEKIFEPVKKYAEERMSQKFCSELDDILTDCYTEAVHYAGTIGMELAFGVANGTIHQEIGG